MGAMRTHAGEGQEDGQTGIAMNTTMDQADAAPLRVALEQEEAVEDEAALQTRRNSAHRTLLNAPTATLGASGSKSSALAAHGLGGAERRVSDTARHAAPAAAEGMKGAP